MSTRFRVESGVIIADILGRVTGARGVELSRALHAALGEEGAPDQVLINLAKCQDLDLVALRVLANASKELVFHRHGSFGMAYVSNAIRSRLISAALLHRFEIFDDEHEGVRQFSNRRRAFESLTAHTIVCGYGRLGSHVATELREAGVDCVVVDADPNKVALARDDGFAAVEGDSTEEGVLQQAGVEQARQLVAALSTDTDNMLVTIGARAAKAELVIVARANDDESIPQLREAGANGVVGLYRISAHHMARALLDTDESHAAA